MKLLLIMSFLIGINLYSKDFQTMEVKLASANVEYKNFGFLKSNQNKISDIVNLMETLEQNMKGFEERKIVIKLKKYFINKYLITDVDMLPLRNNLNAVIDNLNKKDNNN